MNETQVLYCDTSDKTNNIKSKQKHNNSKPHKHKEKYGTFKEYEFNKPKIAELNFKFNDTIKDCRSKYFPSFKDRCVYDIKLTNLKNREEDISPFTFGYMKFKSHSYGLIEKITTALKN